MFRRNSVIVLLAVLALGLGVFVPLAAQETDTQAAHTAAVERLTEEFLNAAQLDVLDEIYAADAIHHSPLGDLDVATRKLTRAGLGMAMPDFKVEIVALTANEEWVSVLYSFTGTFTGELPTPDGALVPGNDAEVQLFISNFLRFDEAGLVAESWETYDNLSLLTQMGMMPTPGSGS